MHIMSMSLYIVIIDYQLVLYRAFEEDKTLSDAKRQNILYCSRYNIYEAGI